jgi:hypothetical protein
MLAYVTGSVDEELLRRNEYLVTENRILRNQIKGRIRLTDADTPKERIEGPAGVVANLAHFRWETHCHGLVQLPAAA